jgi:hypothetical protein
MADEDVKKGKTTKERESTLKKSWILVFMPENKGGFPNSRI